MIILVVHNSYQEPGGEDIVVDQEIAMLRDAGHKVLEYRRSNLEADASGIREKIAIAKQVIEIPERRLPSLQVC